MRRIIWGQLELTNIEFSCLFARRFSLLEVFVVISQSLSFVTNCISHLNYCIDQLYHSSLLFLWPAVFHTCTLETFLILPPNIILKRGPCCPLSSSVFTVYMMRCSWWKVISGGAAAKVEHGYLQSVRWPLLLLQKSPIVELQKWPLHLVSKSPLGEDRINAVETTTFQHLDSSIVFYELGHLLCSGHSMIVPCKALLCPGRNQRRQTRPTRSQVAKPQIQMHTLRSYSASWLTVREAIF